MDWSAVISLLGAFGIGSAVTQFVTGGRDRRSIRAGVLTHLASVEQARWSPSEIAPTLDGFKDRLHALETAALVARIPRDVVRQYMVMASVARFVCDQSVEDAIHQDGAGIIPSALANAVRDEAEAVAVLAWSPMRGRYRMRSRLRKRAETALQVVEPNTYLRRAENFIGVRVSQLTDHTEDD